VRFEYKFTLSIGFAGEGHEDFYTPEDMGYTNEEWAELEDKEKEVVLEDTYLEWRNGYIDGGYSLHVEVTEDDKA